MTPESLLADLRARGVALALDGGRVHYRAMIGVLTAEDRALIRGHRDALRTLLVLDVIPGARVVTEDPFRKRDEGRWRRRYGDLPRQFHRLVPAREWCAALEAIR